MNLRPYDELVGIVSRAGGEGAKTEDQDQSANRGVLGDHDGLPSIRFDSGGLPSKSDAAADGKPVAARKPTRIRAPRLPAQRRAAVPTGVSPIGLSFSLQPIVGTAKSRMNLEAISLLGAKPPRGREVGCPHCAPASARERATAAWPFACTGQRAAGGSASTRTEDSMEK